MMKDRTVIQRVKIQRDARLNEGWQEARVWIPSEKDAEDIRNLATERRSKAEQLEGLTKVVPKLNLETVTRIAEAIARHGSKEYVNPSGAILDLMTKLADEDDLRGFAHTIVFIMRAKPINAKFVIQCVPAKISNFLIKLRGVSVTDWVRWANANPKWSDQLKNSVRHPEQFERVVEEMARSIKVFAKAN